MQLFGGLVAGDPGAAYQGSQKRGLDMDREQQLIELGKQNITAGKSSLDQGGIVTNWLQGGGIQDLLGPGAVTGPGMVPGAIPAGRMRAGGDVVPGDPTQPPPGVEYLPEPAGPNDPDYTFGAAAQPQQTAQMVDPMEVQRQRGLATLAAAMRSQPGSALAFQPPPPQAPLPPQMQAPPAGPGAQPVPMAQQPQPQPQPQPVQPQMVPARAQQPAGAAGPTGPVMVTRQPPQAAPQRPQAPQQAPQQQPMPAWMDPIKVMQSIAKANPGADPNALLGATERVMKMLGQSAEARALSRMYGGAGGVSRAALPNAVQARMARTGESYDEAYAALAGERAKSAAEGPMFARGQQRTLNSFMTPHGNTAGGNLVAVNTTVGHLSTMAELGKKLGNSPIRMVNSIAQRIAEATGQEAPTTFDTARIFIANEINKVLVASGSGTGEERTELSNRFNRMNSPEQLNAAIDLARKLLSDRLKSLQKAWDVAKLDDVTGIKFNQFLRPETAKYFSLDVKPKRQAISKDPDPTQADTGAGDAVEWEVGPDGTPRPKQ